MTYALLVLVGFVAGAFAMFVVGEWLFRSEQRRSVNDAVRHEGFEVRETSPDRLRSLFIRWSASETMSLEDMRRETLAAADAWEAAEERLRVANFIIDDKQRLEETLVERLRL